MLRRFFDWNRRVCDRIEGRLAEGHGRVTVQYARGIGEVLSRHPGTVVLDIGAGGRCSFAEYLEPGTAVRIIGVDVEPRALRRNPDVDFRCVADAARGLPFHDASADMVVSHNVLEHLPDVEAFFAEAARVLKPGGRFVHLLSGRYAPFAVVNRLLPHALSQRLLFYLRPEAQADSGHRTHYDCCYHSAVRRMLRKHGFAGSVRAGYYQSSYFAFFVPFFLLSAAYEFVLRTLRLRNLGAYLIINARKL